MFACGAYADDFGTAMTNVKNNCSNISGDLNDLKKMAGINTAITGVGTATAIGATAVGIAKSSVDEEIENIIQKALEGKTKPAENPNEKDVKDAIDAYFKESSKSANDTDTQNLDELAEKSEKSKNLGNWRTGLLGASTATNVAGAVIAGNNKVDDDLQTKARMDGIDVTQAQKIVSACSKWEEADLSKVNDRAKGAMISSIVGATTGIAGTVTSAVANSDKTRAGDKDTEKNLNTTSNILAGGTTIASGVATAFNATQISAVKKIVTIAEECEETLK